MSACAAAIPCKDSFFVRQFYLSDCLFVGKLYFSELTGEILPNVEKVHACRLCTAVNFRIDNRTVALSQHYLKEEASDGRAVSTKYSKDGSSSCIWLN